MSIERLRKLHAAAISLKVRAGTRVVVNANPASRALYTGLPADGEAGEVSAVSFGSTKRTFLPGPGGGMVYVKFDNGAFMGVSPHDLDKEPKGKKASPIDTLRDLHAACCGGCDEPAEPGMDDEMMAGRKWDGHKDKPDSPYQNRKDEPGHPGADPRNEYNKWWAENFWKAKAADGLAALPDLDDDTVDDILSEVLFDGEMADQNACGLDKVATGLDRLRVLAGKEASTVAQTILAQMGGARRLMMMLGVKQFVTGSNSVSFRWPNKQRSKGNSVKVSLRGDDTYDMEFFNVAKYAAKSVKKHSGVYAEDLVGLFEKQTGWHLRLGRELFSKAGFRKMFAADSPMGLMGEEIFAEGCPDNLDEKQCKEWEFNTLRHKDEFTKGKESAGILGPPTDKAMDQEFGRMTQRPAKNGWWNAHGGGMSVYYSEVDVSVAARKGGPLYLWSAPGGNGKMMGWLTPKWAKMLNKSLTQGAAQRRRADWETGKKVEDTSGPGVGDGEGSDVPDGDGNTTKRAYDEQEATDILEELAGGSRGAFKMMDLWKRANQAGSERDRRNGIVKPVEIFIKAAKRERFSDKAIKHYVEEIQGSSLPRGWNRLATIPMRVRTQPRVAASLYVAISGDKLLGATDSKSGAEKSGWKNVARVKKVNSFEIVHAKNVPDSLAVQMVDFGAGNEKTSAWKDEKTAFRAVSKYLPKQGKTAASKLTPEQIAEVKKEMVSKGVPVRFMSGGGSLDIVSGKVSAKGTNVMHQIVYWNFTKETAKKIAQWLGARASFDKSASEEGEADSLGGKTAGTGNYGFTKAMQRDIDVASRRIAKAAASTARQVHSKDARVADFLVAHAKRGKSLSAQVLVAALQEMAPKLASEDGAKAARLQELREANEDAKTASTDKEAKYGLYGYRSKTSKLGLGACSDLRHESGRIGSDLHRRRHAKHAQISEYLKTHCKESGCNYSKLLMAGYPAEDMKFASLPEPQSIDDWIAWED